MIEIVSFGYGHAAPPPATITLDLRVHYRDPHVDTALRALTAFDQRVIDAVLATDGIPELIDIAADTLMIYLGAPTAADITLAVGCRGGRLRAPVVATQAGLRFDRFAAAAGIDMRARVTHRDLHRPVLATTS